ncbi:hypothetical protein E0H33_00620 [Rhizobium leguminosarum bv. viciae]|nr:hypothetical protein E0H32_07325 [Rhizobium leguminosarum bv. viciae]TBZ21039.1 hypothetical protein E0H33_00620 [Rhizobium leguminosarum bv. viciae]
MRGTERSRHIPFAPFTGRRWRQPDEGAGARRAQDDVDTKGTRPTRRALLPQLEQSRSCRKKFIRKSRPKKSVTSSKGTRRPQTSRIMPSKTGSR